MATAAPAEPAALASWPAQCLLGRIGGYLFGPGIADRAIRRAAFASSHVTALVAHDGSAGPLLVGSANVAVTTRSSATGPHVLGCAAIAFPPRSEHSFRG